MGDVGDFLTRISPEKANPTVVYEGPRPDSHNDVYAAAQWERHASYVYLFARDGWVIYVGMSTNPGRRFEVHHWSKDWFLVANEYVLLKLTRSQLWASRDDARMVERAAIGMFGPSHNRAGVDPWHGITLAS